MIDDIMAVATHHADQIRRELETARRARADAREVLEGWDRRVAGLEWLLEQASESDPKEAHRTMTLHEAMTEVLRTAPQRRMRAVELAAQIEARKLYRMRDGRAVEPQQIHARAGNYERLFGRDGNFIVLK